MLHLLVRRAGALAVVVSLAAAASAVAATKHGITPVAPKAGTSVRAGESPTFRMRVKGPGQVWVHVCRSRKKDNAGVICSKESLGRAKKKNGAFRFTPGFYDYPGFWLQRPGVYYWQAYRIHCNAADCEQEGPVVRFRVTSPPPAVQPAPTPAPVTPTPTPAPSQSCDPNYSGCLDPNAYDYDCIGGLGDGPLYTGPVYIYGDDHFALDRDGDGIGCEG